MSTLLNEPFGTLLNYAIIHGNLGIIHLLLENGANVKYTDNRLRTPLSYAIRDGSLEIAQLLLENGADINAPDEKVGTPLGFARSKSK